MNQIFWRQSAQARRGGSCLFLDRDGVVVEEVEYLHRAEDVRVLPGAAEVIASARKRGWAVGLVTNQAGIGRGYYDWMAFAAVQSALDTLLGIETEPFDFIAACGTHPEANQEQLRIFDHSWRKPRPGMLLMAAHALNLDLSNSVMVGDQITDLQAGLSAGVGRVAHVSTGHGDNSLAAAQALAAKLGPDRVLLLRGLDDLPAALHWV